MSRKLPCPIQRECRICPHVNASYEKTLEEKSRRDLKQLELAGLLKNTRIQRTIASPRKLGFRTIFKLAVRKNPDSQSIDRFRLGLFRPGSHQIGPNLVSCPLHVSSLRALLKTLHPILEASSLNPYDEASHHGDLRYLIGRTNQEGNQLMLTWVVTRNVEEEIRRLIQELSRKGISVDVQAMNIHPDRDNSIWGKETRLISDQKYIEENLVGNHLELGPMSFFQVNPWQAENIYQRIDRIAQNQKEKKVAWDVFSGVGPISLCLARSFERVLSFEENPEAVERAKVNAKNNGYQEKIDVAGGVAEESMAKIPDWAMNPSLIVVNPSRRGIHENARRALCQIVRNRSDVELVYLSCNRDTFIRDLVDFGAYSIRLHELQGFDMHAQSDQMEWLGRLKVVAL